MGLIGILRVLRWRAAGHLSRPLPAAFLTPLQGARALEIGGPSAVFQGDGLLPAYPALASVDGVQWSRTTVWHGAMEEGRYEPDGNGVGGRLWILEAADIGAIPDASYDAVLSSHVIEHIANPVRALREWRRVIRPGGHLLAVVPHKEGTFDHRRPTTPLNHMIDDERKRTGEDDLTHLDEILALHDLTRDPAAGDFDEFARLRRDNVHHRVIHHHTFTTRSLLELIDHIDLQIVAAETRWPHDIYCLARVPVEGELANNCAFLDSSADVLRSSPFHCDRSQR